MPEAFLQSFLMLFRIYLCSKTPILKYVILKSVGQSLPACPKPLQYGHFYKKSLLNSTYNVPAAYLIFWSVAEAYIASKRDLKSQVAIFSLTYN